jgi:small subunit ribosomal protein S1
LVGKTLPVKITEVDRSRNRLILSAEAAQKEILQKRFEEIKKGQVVTGKVVKILDFGAFVDLGSVDGLVHITQLAWKKPNHPSEVVSLGDEIEVKIIDVDVERQRISLSRKALLPGPWQTLGDELKAGDYIEGVVTRLVDFGAFVKLPMGIEGLIHTSQIGYSSSQNPQSVIKPGDRVLLKVLEVNSERKRVALSMRQVPMERQIAWAMGNLEAEAAPEPKHGSERTMPPKPEAEHHPEQEPEIGAKPDIETPDASMPETEPEPALAEEPESPPEASSTQETETPPEAAPETTTPEES